MSGNCGKGQTDDAKTKMKEESQAPSADFQQRGAHIGNVGNVSGSFNPISVGSQVTFTVSNAPPPEKRAGTVSPQSGNPTAGTASQNPQSGNPTADSQQQGAHIGNTGNIEGNFNPISVGSEVTFTVKNAPPPQRADATGRGDNTPDSQNH